MNFSRQASIGSKTVAHLNRGDYFRYEGSCVVVFNMAGSTNDQNIILDILPCDSFGSLSSAVNNDLDSHLDQIEIDKKATVNVIGNNANGLPQLKR